MHRLGMRDLQVQRDLMKRNVETPIIFVADHTEVSTAVQAMRNGAFTVLTMPYDDQAVLEYIKDALREVSQRRQIRGERDSIDARIASLSPRQRQVMDLLAEGCANKKIAYRLGISPRTVEIHRAHVMTRLDVGSFAALVRLVVKSSERPWPPGHIPRLC